MLEVKSGVLIETGMKKSRSAAPYSRSEAVFVIERGMKKSRSEAAWSKSKVAF